jgi:protein involved in ribonucleotide reduction
MKKVIIYSSLVISALIFIIALCVFVIKVDYIKVCYFINDGASSSIIVDKKTSQFLDSQQNKNCIIMISDHKYKAYLTYDEYLDKGYHY